MRSQILLACVLIMAIIAHARSSENVREFEGHTYTIVVDKKNWQMANRDAQSRGGYLVEISSPKEQRFLEKFIDDHLKEKITPIWIGLTDEELEGEWKWTNGMPLVFTNWQKNQPSNNNSITPEHYCVIWHKNERVGAKKGQWNDVAGDNNLPYIIEFESLENR